MTELAKNLSATRGAALMLNIVLGAGLLTLPGLVVSQVGAYALWAWAACAAASVPLVGVFIVMGRRFPHAGGVAHFASAAFGPAAHCVASFVFLGAVVFGLPAIALTGGYYLAEVLPGRPALFAAVFVVSAVAVNCLSAEATARLSAVVASAVLLLLSALVVVGFFAVDWRREGSFPPIAAADITIIFAPFMLIFFAFTGWEVAAGAAEEFKNPKRDFPRAMLASFAVVCLLYFAMAFIVQNAPLSGAYEAPFVSIVGVVLGDAGEVAVALLAAAIIFANLTGAIWAVSRMVFSLAREGYLPVMLTAGKNGTPFVAVLSTAAALLLVLSADWLGLLNIDAMLSIAGLNFFILSGVVALALFRLSGNWAEKTLSIVAAAIVAGLLAAEDASLIYPLVLSILALAVWRYRARVTPVAARR